MEILALSIEIYFLALPRRYAKRYNPFFTNNLKSLTMPLHPILTSILDNKREEVGYLKSLIPEVVIREKASLRAPCRSLRDAVGAGNGGVKVIAEIKRSTPTVMLRATSFDPVKIAKSYEAGGAVALSVLTDARFFSGHSLYVPMTRDQVSIPVLRKEFIIDSWQVVETAALGADAILLMAVCLTDDQLAEYFELAQELGLEPLVEIHNEKEWERVKKLGPKLVGINNRDFLSKNLDVDIDATLRLAPVLPNDVTVISESGVSTADDLRKLIKAGADGFLIGTAFMKEDYPGAALAKLLSETEPG